MTDRGMENINLCLAVRPSQQNRANQLMERAGAEEANKGVH